VFIVHPWPAIKTSMAGPVLIIEDDPDIAEILRYGLENENFKTRVALNGEDGLVASLDQHNPPSIILLDILLPGMNGFELCRRLREESLTRSTPILIVSARASEKDLAIGRELGVGGYIVKPFSIREVIARVNSLLQARLVS
jgi:DNA-binding response OmpR family regulator